ncbi:MAG: ROK family transcriptional regulator [Clostridia bacterium]|nr:ROK family transcriptional regulator [Clostridia bacterium]
MKAYVASDLRDLNRKSVFSFISSRDEVSKTMIARETGISGPTVIKIVSFLLEQGLIEGNGERGGSVGRKSHMLRLNKNARYAIGAAVEGKYIRVGAVNLQGEISCVETAKSDGADITELIECIVPQTVEKLIKKSGIERERFLGIGLGLPCSYDVDRHIASFAPLIDMRDGICTTESEKKLCDLLGLPLVVDNDVNMEVIGEYYRRGLQGADLAYISIGTGLGAGIVLEGKLRRGTNAQCGEIGYMVFENNYTVGLNNAGWLEKRVNLEALKRRFGFDLSHADDCDLSELIEYVSEKIALCITNFASIIDCGIVCLGGVLASKLSDALLDSVRNMLKKLCAISIDLQKPICEDAGIVGASRQVIDRELDLMLER